MINGADYMNWRDIVFGGGGGCLTTSAYESANIGLSLIHISFPEVQSKELLQSPDHPSVPGFP